MGITVTLYKNFEKRENSTKLPLVSDAHTDFICTLKAGTSVTDPVLEIYLSGQDPADTPVGSGYNYAYIPKWSRYYFITDWKYVNGIWVAYLHVDVLATYKGTIGSSAPYVLRSASNGNDDIVDTLFPATETWAESEKNFTTQPFSPSTTRPCYVVGIISQPAPASPSDEPGANTQGCVTYYGTTSKGVRDIIRYLMSDEFVNGFLADPLAGLTATAVKNFVDPLQYIESVRYYPFDIYDPDAALTPVKPQLGFYDMTGTNFPFVLVPLPSLTATRTGQSAIDVNPYSTDPGKGFLNQPPYVEYDLLLEPWGIIPLNASLMKGRANLYTTIDVDYVTGLARMAVGTASGRADLGIYSAIVGVDISLAQITQDVMGAASSLVGGIVGTVGAALTGNVGGAISSAANGITNALDNFKPQASVSGANNSMIAYKGTNKGATLRMRYCDCVGFAPAEYGRAYCDTPTSINALSGYIKCGHGDIDMRGLDSERRAVKAYLEGGFFYE